MLRTAHLHNGKHDQKTSRVRLIRKTPLAAAPVTSDPSCPWAPAAALAGGIWPAPRHSHSRSESSKRPHPAPAPVRVSPLVVLSGAVTGFSRPIPLPVSVLSSGFPKRLPGTPATDRRRGNERALQREKRGRGGEIAGGLAGAAASELTFLTARDRRPPQGHGRDKRPGVTGSR